MATTFSATIDDEAMARRFAATWRLGGVHAGTEREADELAAVLLWRRGALDEHAGEHVVIKASPAGGVVVAHGDRVEDVIKLAETRLPDDDYVSTLHVPIKIIRGNAM